MCRHRRRTEDLSAEFELLGDWEERYRYVIDLGRDLAPSDRRRALGRQQGARLRQPGLAGHRAAGDGTLEVPRRLRRPHRARPDRHPAQALFRPSPGEIRAFDAKRRFASWA
jgi:cysteine desulfuration protein SufE